ncbi:potassium channel family protein [Agromyces sp. SYSU T0242]|uniref:potassium channel family protein n=1 Tax=Agromyces litoreus TaxID=3158561 RepID=UPI003398D429
MRIGREGRRERWIERTSGVMAVLGILFVAAYVGAVLFPEFASRWRGFFNAVYVITWIAFIVDFAVRLALTPAGARWAYTRTHPIELLSVFLPVFRALRVVSLLQHVKFLQRRTAGAVRANFVLTAVAYAAMYVFFLAVATLQAERNAPGATITNFGDALWWAVVTLTTVGYGDTYPVTTVGRLWAVLLMIGGIAIVGVASATVISLLNDRLAAIRSGHAQPGDLLAEREALRADPDDRADGASGDGDGPDGDR